MQPPPINKVFSFPVLLTILVVALAACRTDSEPAGGVLDGVPSLAETLGTIVPTPPPLPTADPAAVALGETIYTLHCAVCHGADLEGEADWKTPNPDGSFKAPPHDPDGHTWHHSDRVLIETILKGGTRLTGAMAGASAMPAYEDVLTMEEITAVLTYIKSTWPEDIRQIQWERTASDS